MQNLLPPETKNEIAHEYRLRFFVVCVALIAVTFLVNIAVSLPYFFTAYASRSATEGVTGLGPTDESTTTKEVETRFDTFTGQINLLKKSAVDTSTSTTDSVTAAISDKPKSVVLTSFSISTDAKGVGSMEITGVASSREDLQAYADRLSADGSFSKIDLPISNFSKKTNIDFSVNVILSK